MNIRGIIRQRKYNMAKKHIVTAYKSESDCISRGCVVESYRSDFQWLSTDDENEFRNFIADLMMSDHLKEDQEDSYEIVHFLDGEHSDTYKDDIEILALFEQKKNKHQEEKERYKKEQEEREKQEREKNERALYEKLRNQYGE